MKRSNHTRLTLLATILLAFGTLSAHADAPADLAHHATLRPVASLFGVEYGHTNLTDTYLTPIQYGGRHVGLSYSHTQATGFNPRRWVRQLHIGLDYDHTKNPAGNHTMHAFTLEGRWALMYRRKGLLHPQLQLMAGGSTALHTGVLYNAANSNNVASAKAHWNIGLHATATFATHLRRLPITFGYNLNLPLLGIFFAPHYGEPYYEIYLGNRRHLVHCAHLGNHYDIDHLLWADLHLGATVLRLGYHYRLRQSFIHHTDYRHATHAVVIAIGGDFVCLRTQRHPAGTNNAASQAVSSIYY